MNIFTASTRVLACAALLLTVGCSAFSQFDAHTATQVELGGDNFHVVQTNVLGTDSGWALLGIIPFAAPNVNRAMENLISQVRDYDGSTRALINVTQGRTGSYWILFGIYTIEVRADVIEFLDD